MNICAVRKYNRSTKILKRTIQEHGFEYSSVKPDVVLTIGGDGTLFMAERKYPGIPKLMIRNSQVCQRCGENNLVRVLKNIKNYKKIKLPKLEARISGKKHIFLGLNDIVIRNRRVTRALRFKVFVNNKPIGEFIGDGVIAATPHGATGYFFAATKEKFSKNWAIGLSNSTSKQKPIYLKQTDVVKVELIRSAATVSADNDTTILTANAGDVIGIKLSRKESILLQ